VRAALERSNTLLQLALRALQLGPLLILLVLVSLLSLVEPLFLTERNIQNVLVQTSVIACLAIGQLLVILTAGIDLSVGSAIALTTVVGALVFDTSAGSGLTVALAIVGTGALIGTVNGLLYVKGRLPHPFIPTLAMLSGASGLALILADGRPQPGMPPLIVSLGSDYVGPIPVPALVVAVLAGVAYLLTRHMKWGRWIYAVGGNPESAARVGIPVGRVLISVYVMAGIAAGVAGIITAGRTESGYPTAGQLGELDSIAAVIIGGASFLGGRGGVSNALIGALIIGVIRNGLNLLGLTTFWQLVVIGATIVAAVELDVLRRHFEARVQVLHAEAAAA
jgi:ribose transport system permease protein